MTGPRFPTPLIRSSGQAAPDFAQGGDRLNGSKLELEGGFCYISHAQVRYGPAYERATSRLGVTVERNCQPSLRRCTSGQNYPRPSHSTAPSYRELPRWFFSNLDQNLSNSSSLIESISESDTPGPSPTPATFAREDAACWPFSIVASFCAVCFAP